MRFVFLGTPDFASRVLRVCVELGSVPVAVLTQKSKPRGRGQKVSPSPVKTQAEALGIEVMEIDDINQEAERLKSLNLDLMAVAAYGQILKEKILTIPKLGALNVHGSLLPKYRGAAPIQWAIWNGETQSGVTIQRMVKQLDAGDILLQEKVALKPDETSATLFESLSVLGGQSLHLAIEELKKGQAKFIPQDEDQATYAPKLTKEHSKLDLVGRTAIEIERQIRAVQPWPGAELTLFGRKTKLLRAIVKETGPAAGEIQALDQEILVGCRKGSLSLLEVHPENRKPMKVGEFVRGIR